MHLRGLLPAFALFALGFATPIAHALGGSCY
jgi:hypothetical protein